MTTYADQRTGPPPRSCTGCEAALASCEERKTYSGRPCCINHNHPVKES